MSLVVAVVAVEKNKVVDLADSLMVVACVVDSSAWRRDASGGSEDPPCSETLRQLSCRRKGCTCAHFYPSLSRFHTVCCKVG